MSVDKQTIEAVAKKLRLWLPEDAIVKLTNVGYANLAEEILKVLLDMGWRSAGEEKPSDWDYATRLSIMEAEHLELVEALDAAQAMLLRAQDVCKTNNAGNQFFHKSIQFQIDALYWVLAKHQKHRTPEEKPNDR